LRSRWTHLSETSVEGHIDNDVQGRVGDDEQVSQLTEVELDATAQPLFIGQNTPQDLRHERRSAWVWSEEVGDGN